MRILQQSLLAATLLATPLAPLVAQSSSSGMRSNARALALVDSAIAAHGGAARLRALDDVSIMFRGQRWMAYQSERLARPWTTQATRTDLVMDFKNSRVMRYNESRYPRDFLFSGTNVSSPQGGFFYDPQRAGLGDGFIRFSGGSVANHPARRDLPAFQRLALRDRPETVRWLGTRTENGTRLQGASYAEPNGAVYELWLDARTKRLVHLEWLRDDAVDGDQLASYTYSGYRMEQGIPVPTRLVERRNGELVRDDTLAISINSSPAASRFATPTSGFAELTDTRPTGAEAEQVRTLPENVWLLQQLPGGNRVMFVAFRDHVLVIETPTPQAAATAVMDAVRRTVPGKPIRYAASTHHHDDHGGGLRPYIAEGVTIVTTPSNRKFVEHVANARHTLRPDVLSASPRKPIVETFATKRVFTVSRATC